MYRRRAAGSGMVPPPPSPLLCPLLIIEERSPHARPARNNIVSENTRGAVNQKTGTGRNRLSTLVHVHGDTTNVSARGGETERAHLWGS